MSLLALSAPALVCADHLTCAARSLSSSLYRAFDEIAKKRRVFKVETVGDCYVAVTGLPDPRKDHAVSMARFARDCLFRTRALTKKLEVTLGPDTGDLAMRMGIHSGPVTAGVLRGERSRFQLCTLSCLRRFHLDPDLMRPLSVFIPSRRYHEHGSAHGAHW